MASKLVTESGLQLLSRLYSKPSFTFLDRLLFPNGLCRGDVVQISGSPGTGKSLLLIRLMTTCLLPRSFKNIEIGGLGTDVVLIDTDHGISLLKLVSFIERSIYSSLRSETNASVSLNSEELRSLVEEILKDALNRLTILRTYSSMQLRMNFHSLVKILAANANISIVMVDSLTAYYWEDTTNARSFKKMDLYLKVLIDELLKCIKSFNIITIFVKQEYFQSKVRNIQLTQIKHKIDLKKIDEMNNMFCAFVDGVHNSHKYTISNEGFTWVNN